MGTRKENPCIFPIQREETRLLSGARGFGFACGLSSLQPFLTLSGVFVIRPVVFMFYVKLRDVWPLP